MEKTKIKPRILIITPEVTYLPKDMGSNAPYLTAKAGGLADVSANLLSVLFSMRADVHVALPDYRFLFDEQYATLFKKKINRLKSYLPERRIHLAQDVAFFYKSNVYSNLQSENIKTALVFQREIINNILPRVQPDLVHCNDWMTGLIPAFCRHIGIPSLFTIHNIHTVSITLENIEERGIDAFSFWKHLYYKNFPLNYKEARKTNPVDFLLSGVFASHFTNTVSPTFLKEIAEGKHKFVSKSLKFEIHNKISNQCAAGILNSPNPSYHPARDKAISHNYDQKTFYDGKRQNKLFIQRKLRLEENADAPIFFWPHRLDNIQKGCHLLEDIFDSILSRYRHIGLQIIIVGDGEYQNIFRTLIKENRLQRWAAVSNFNENLSRQGFAASDFILMPSRFEPCGLPQMIGPIYGSLPIAHNTGGIHDTISDLDIGSNTGNGFLFKYYDTNGLLWAMEQAINFYLKPREIKEKHIKRIMEEGMVDFTNDTTARAYIQLYESMIKRPLILDEY
jgi:starch synthase/alpha-amylase